MMIPLGHDLLPELLQLALALPQIFQKIGVLGRKSAEKTPMVSQQLVLLPRFLVFLELGVVVKKIISLLMITPFLLQCLNLLFGVQPCVERDVISSPHHRRTFPRLSRG